MTRRATGQLVRVGAVLAVLLLAGYLLYRSNLSPACKSELTIEQFDFIYLGMGYDEIEA